MNTIRRFFLLSAISAFALTSCGEDDDDNGTNGGNPDNNDNLVVSGEINSNTTWESDRIVQLSGRVVVPDGVTLTIEPGTIIKAEGGREANASALIVARGGTIMAEGTAQAPIIFTSLLDEIQPGEIMTPNLEEDFNGLWGGVIILGRAPISADADEVQIEGIPPSDENGLYGGNDAADNSGVFKYVSIRFGGTLIGEGNEINGLTMGGVGNGTTIDHVEVVGNLDDAFEWFGGTVNSSNLISWAQGDDALDIDQAYSGTISNAYCVAGPNSDLALEVDGPEGNSRGQFTMENVTLVGWNSDGTGGGEYADFRDGAEGILNNLYFTGFSESSDVEIDDAKSSDNYKNGDLVFNNWEVNVSHLSNGNRTPAEIFSDESSNGDAFSDYDFVDIVTNPSVGADKSTFRGWTFTDLKGALD